MARVEVEMPQMGESIVEGTIVEWLKQVGDPVELDEDLFTLSTDKVDTEVPSPAQGVVAELLYAVGDTVAVGTIVCVVETDANAVVGEAAPAAAPAAAVAEASAKAAVARPPAMPASTPAAEATGDAAAPPADGEDADSLRLRRSTPVVRKIAAENGITDLGQVKGTGVSGRVTKKDILAFIADGGAANVVPTADGAIPRPPKLPPTRINAPAAGAAGAPAGYQPAFVKAPNVHLYANDRVEPMSRMGVAMAENMLQARRGTAHCHTVWEADMSRVAKARKALSAEYADRNVKLTYTAFFVAAVVDGLRRFPLMNAAIDGENIVFRGDVNLGIAAAVDEGLIVPVLKNADTLNLLGMAKGVNDLGDRARNRRLKPMDVADGTFTLSNAGIWGSLFGVPVLVQPQVGILAVGGIKQRVVADDAGNIRVRPMVNMCLTFDHRLIDGATADGFMKHVTDMLANWEV